MACSGSLFSWVGKDPKGAFCNADTVRELQRCAINKNSPQISYAPKIKPWASPRAFLITRRQKHNCCLSPSSKILRWASNTRLLVSKTRHVHQKRYRCVKNTTVASKATSKTRLLRQNLFATRRIAPRPRPRPRAMARRRRLQKAARCSKGVSSPQQPI